MTDVDSNGFPDFSAGGLGGPSLSKFSPGYGSGLPCSRVTCKLCDREAKRRLCRLSYQPRGEQLQAPLLIFTQLPFTLLQRDEDFLSERGRRGGSLTCSLKQR